LAFASQAKAAATLPHSKSHCLNTLYASILQDWQAESPDTGRLNTPLTLSEKVRGEKTQIKAIACMIKNHTELSTFFFVCAIARITLCISFE
jgi:hypothetical protein